MRHRCALCSCHTGRGGPANLLVGSSLGFSNFNIDVSSYSHYLEKSPRKKAPLLTLSVCKNNYTTTRMPSPNIVNIDVKIVDLCSSCIVHTTPRDGILSLARTYHHLGCMVQMVLMIASLPSGAASTFKYTPIAALLKEYLVQLFT